MKLGIDIDGVLANFTDSYAALLTERTGIQFPKNSAEWPTVWYWDRAAGVQKADESAVWNRIKNGDFWRHLRALPEASETLSTLSESAYRNGNEVYFITTRPGQHAKRLTENWLIANGYEGSPTVLIAENEAAKGLAAKALALDVFIDDKPENCEQVVKATAVEEIVGPGYAAMRTGKVSYPTHVYLLDAPYNRDAVISGVARTYSVLEAVNHELFGGLRRAA